MNVISQVDCIPMVHLDVVRSDANMMQMGQLRAPIKATVCDECISLHTDHAAATDSNGTQQIIHKLSALAACLQLQTEIICACSNSIVHRSVGLSLCGALPVSHI